MIRLNIKNDVSCFLLLLILALFIWLIRLGDLPIRDWDEGYYATVASNMFESGDWLYLKYHNQPFLLKPPLIIWLINLSYHLGGINEFTTRLPCALLTAVGIPLLYLVGRNIFHTQLPAILSSLVYLTSLPILRHGRLAMIDGMVNTFLILCILSLLKSKKQPLWILGFGIGLGMIALSKGILAIALGGVLGVYMLLSDYSKLFKSNLFWIGLLIGFSPVFIWYYFQINFYGEKFIEVHFFQQNFDRLSTAVEGNKGEVWYYILELAKYSFPWLIFFPGGLIVAWKKRQKNLIKLIATGFFLFLFIITIMGTKLPWYIMPVYPFFALATGYNLSYFYSYPKSFPKVLMLGMSALTYLILGLGIYIFREPQQFIFQLIFFTFFNTFLWTNQKLYKKSSSFITVLIVGLYLSLTLLMISNSWLWELNESFPVKSVAKLIRENTPIDTIVYTSFPYNRPSLDFYSKRQVISQNKNELDILALNSSYLLLEDRKALDFKLIDAKMLGEASGFILISTQKE